MNLQRGFFRATLVLSLVLGVVSALLLPKPTFKRFHFRPATALEKADAQKWMDEHKTAANMDGDLWVVTAFNNSVTIEYGVLKQNQNILPLLFFLRYYLSPFTLTAAATWAVYVLMRFVVFGYVVKGFNTNA